MKKIGFLLVLIVSIILVSCGGKTDGIPKKFENAIILHSNELMGYNKTVGDLFSHPKETNSVSYKVDGKRLTISNNFDIKGKEANSDIVFEIGSDGATCFIPKLTFNVPALFKEDTFTCINPNSDIGNYGMILGVMGSLLEYMYD